MAKRLGLVALLVLATACPGRRTGPQPGTSPRAGNNRNVLLVTIDTLRADHLGVYGYRRATSPRIDSLAQRGMLFERAYTFWPKTLASMICMMTGLYPSMNGYDQQHRQLYGFNPTLASVLSAAGYQTAAIVDNANVAGSLGFGKGFDSFYEIWTDKSVKDESEGARVISTRALRFLSDAPRDRPFFLWLHYVNPHAPYTPPAPHDAQFADAEAQAGPELKPVTGFDGGVRRVWAVPGHMRLGYYVSQYDGEIALTDAEVGRVLDGLAASGHAGDTVVAVTSDHGESLGEHNYYFDHGADLFDPCLHVPLIVVDPQAKTGGRSDVLASTLDIVPTLLDAVKVSYPPDLAGMSLWPVVQGQSVRPRERLFAENDRGLIGTHDGRFKLVREPKAAGREALYDRKTDAGELRDVSAQLAQEAKAQRAALDAYASARDSEWRQTRQRLAAPSTAGPVMRTCDECSRLKALGYVDDCSSVCP
jgi:arylsulfatase A-like enzyme